MSRIIRVSDAWALANSGIASEHTPDEASLPTIDWCETHGLVCNGGTMPLLRHECRATRVPLPVHLGVEVAS